MITDFDYRDSVMKDALNLYDSNWSRQALLYLTVLFVSTFAALVGDVKFHLRMSTVAIYTVAVTLLLLLVIPFAQAAVSRLFRLIPSFSEASHFVGRPPSEIKESPLKQRLRDSASTRIPHVEVALEGITSKSRVDWLAELDHSYAMDYQAYHQQLNSELEAARQRFEAVMTQARFEVREAASLISNAFTRLERVDYEFSAGRLKPLDVHPASKRARITVLLALTDWAMQEIARAQALEDLSPGGLSQSPQDAPWENDFGFLGWLSKDPNQSRER
jgi:hypothetical protein